MKNRNWRIFGLIAALALLCACLLGGAALAEAELKLRVTGLDGLEVASADGTFQGRTYYKVHVKLEGDPEPQDFEWTMKTDGSDNPDWSKPLTKNNCRSEGGEYTIDFDAHDPYDDPSNPVTVFFRLDETDAVKKLVLKFNTFEAKPTIPRRSPSTARRSRIPRSK